MKKIVRVEKETFEGFKNELKLPKYYKTANKFVVIPFEAMRSKELVGWEFGGHDFVVAEGRKK
jgi:hypothetical protein